jgi:hypothetical protein
MLKEFRYYSQLSRSIVKWIRSPVVPNPLGEIQKNIRQREVNFLYLLQSAILSNPNHPIKKLLDWAGIGYEEIRARLERSGLEETLQELYSQGVYLTHDEFKGKQEVRRGALTFSVASADLANPLYLATMEASSSGSRGNPTITRRSLEYQAYRELQETVFLNALELKERAQLATTAALPATGGLRRLITHARYGNPVAAWMPLRPVFHYRALTCMMLSQIRAMGISAPFPTYLPEDNYTPIAEWIAAQKKQGKRVLVTGNVSPAVRVVAAANDLGLDLSDTRFVVGGEAITAAKVSIVEKAGARIHARYTISELGPVGFGCTQMQGNCVHVSRDALAVIARERFAPLTDTKVQSLLFTTLLPFAPTVAINLEMDDAGEIGTANCGCELMHAGFTQKIDHIYSYGKLTGYGTSLMAEDMLSILEVSLPKRFGGVPSDYQLIEQEAGKHTAIELRVHPRLGVTSETEVQDFFMRELQRIWSGSSTGRTWSQSGSFSVRFAPPIQTNGKKIHPLHLLGKPSPLP